MCLLGSATDAVKAGLEIIEAMRTASGDTIRVSIETGDVEEIGGDAFGDPVNLSARILSRTPAGEVWFGPGARACMNESELSWEPVGNFSFKGIAGEPLCCRAVPSGRAWLSETLCDAIAERRLVRVRPDQLLGKFPSDAIVLLEGFKPGADNTTNVLKAMPVLEPKQIYLASATIAAADRIAWQDSGRQLLIGDEDGVTHAIAQVEAELSFSASPDDIDSLHAGETMVVTGLTALKNMELTVCGLALPQVPFSGIVSSYSYDLLADGNWSTRADQALLRVDVRSDGVLLHALRRGVEVDGHPLKAGTTIAPLNSTVIRVPNGELRYQELQDSYAGIIFFESNTSVTIKPGQAVEIGRSPNPPGLALPSRPGKSNIQWCSGEPARRAKERGFTMDRVLAGRRQAALHISQDGIHLTPLHKSCPTYVLGVSGLRRISVAERIGIADRVVAGTNVVGLRAAA